MNKTKIEWTDYTWNAVTGCERNCWYCYVKRIKGYDRAPTFHKSRLNQPTGVRKPSKIFVCSTADLFGEWIPDEWISEIFCITKFAGWHTYQVLTKNPVRLQNFKFGENVWLGTTIEDYHNAKRIYDLSLTKHKNLFVSFEPLLTGMSDIPYYLYIDIKWIIIGAYTGKNRGNHPTRESWVKEIIVNADKFKIPVFMKNNLKPEWPHRLRQEFPVAKGDK